VQPDIKVRPGWPLRVIVHKDLVFRRPYRETASDCLKTKEGTRRVDPKPVIGTFSAVKDGYAGTIRTLTLKINSSPTIAGRPMASPTFASWRGSAEIGAAWPRRSGAAHELQSGTGVHDIQAEPRAVPRPALSSRLQFEENSRPRLVPGGAIVLVAGGRSPFCYNKGWPVSGCGAAPSHSEPAKGGFSTKGRTGARTTTLVCSTSARRRTKRTVAPSGQGAVVLGLSGHLDAQPWAIEALAVIAKLDLSDHEPSLSPRNTSTSNTRLLHGAM
jgi:hypothetical protein